MKRITPKALGIPERRSFRQQRKTDRITPQTRELRRVLRAAYRQREHGQKRGLIILLAGPPGTVKTKTAELIAAETGQPLYRVDLASVISKYIDATEKNLKRVFDAAASRNMILLLDEADKLFGKRTAVNDANGRHAHIDVTHILKRIEAYPGIVIVTTNLLASLDPAFTRHARFTVDLSLPENEGEEDSDDR